MQFNLIKTEIILKKTYIHIILSIFDALSRILHINSLIYLYRSKVWEETKSDLELIYLLKLTYSKSITNLLLTKYLIKNRKIL